MNAQRNAMTIEKVRQAGVTDEMQAVMDQVQRKTLLLDTLEEVRQAGVTDEMRAVMDQVQKKTLLLDALDKVRQAGVTDEMQAVLDQVQKKTLLLDALDQVYLYSRATTTSTANQIFNSYWMLRNNIINVL